MKPGTLAHRAARRITVWRARDAARRALSAASYGNCDEGHRLTARAAKAGPDAIVSMVEVWCDVITADIPDDERNDRCGPVFRHVISGDYVDPGEVPAPVRWFGQLLAAHVRGDTDTFVALIRAVHPLELRMYLSGVLHAAAAVDVARNADREWP